MTNKKDSRYRRTSLKMKLNILLCKKNRYRQRCFLYILILAWENSRICIFITFLRKYILEFARGPSRPVISFLYLSLNLKLFDQLNLKSGKQYNDLFRSAPANKTVIILVSFFLAVTDE